MERTEPITEENLKLVVLVNKRLPSGVTMNALAHAVAGLVNLIGEQGRSGLNFLSFSDKDGQVYPSVSARSFIVLRGTDGDIRKLRRAATEAGFPTVCFHDAMTGDTYVEQLERSKTTNTSELTYYAVAVFGRANLLAPLTRRYSIWRSDSDHEAPGGPGAL